MHLKLTLLLALLFVLVASTRGDFGNSAPFFVMFKIHPYSYDKEMYNVAGGSLISNRHILTAASIFTDLFLNDGFFTIGFPGKALFIYGLNDNGDFIHRDTFSFGYELRREHITIHPLFMNRTQDPTAMDHDLAIVTLPELLDCSHLFPTVPLHTNWSEDLESKEVKIFGMGRISLTDPTEYASVLQVGGMTVVPSICERHSINGSLHFNNTEHICLLGNNGVTPCEGDDGGPVIYNGKLVGVMGWVNSSCDSAWPTVVTRVAHFQDWIFSNIE